MTRTTVTAAPVSPAPAWCHALAAQILTTVQEWAEEGATDEQLRACIADLLEEALA